MAKIYVYYNHTQEKFVLRYLTGILNRDLGSENSYVHELVQIIHFPPGSPSTPLLKGRKIRSLYKKYKLQRKLKKHILKKHIAEYRERRKAIWRGQ